MAKGVFRVTETIEGANPVQTHYPLLPNDYLSEQPDGTFQKFAPGLGITGFVLTPVQRATLEPVEQAPAFKIVGLAEYMGGAA